MTREYISNSPSKELAPLQELLLFYDDLITDILFKADEFDLTSSKIELQSNQTLPEKNVIDWLLQNGFESAAYHYLKSHLFFSLLRDFIFYMHESFDCASRKKITVAYAIVRKPMKDTLFYLCWLLVDDKDLINKLRSKNSKEYDVSSISKKRKMEKFNKAGEMSGNSLEKNFIFDMIYNGNYKKSLTRLCNLSLHLVTGDSRFTTQTGNLNFVFAYENIWDDYIRYYYETIPLLMAFAIEVILKIFESILQPESNMIVINKIIRDFKFIKAAGNLSQNSNENLSQYYKNVLKNITFCCQTCQQNFKYSSFIGDEFVNELFFTCPHCGFKNNVGSYFL